MQNASFELARKAGLEAAWQTGFDEFAMDGHRFRWAYDVYGRKAKHLIVCYPDGKLSGCREKWNYRDRIMYYNVLGLWKTEGDLRTPGPEALPLPADSIKPNKASAESKAVVRVPVVEQQELIMEVIREKAGRNGVWFAPMSTLEALTGLSKTQVKDRVSELERSRRLMAVGRRGKGTTFIVR